MHLKVGKVCSSIKQLGYRVFLLASDLTFSGKKKNLVHSRVSNSKLCIRKFTKQFKC